MRYDQHTERHRRAISIDSKNRVVSSERELDPKILHDE